MRKRCKVSAQTVANLASMDAAEFRKVMDDIDASLDMMAELLGIARRNAASYRKDLVIPPAVALAARHIHTLVPRSGQ